MSITKNMPLKSKMMYFNENFFRKIWIIFDIFDAFESQNFAISDNFYSTDRKT